MISFKDFIYESKFISKKNYKKGDVVETSNGTKYYVNGVTPELDKLWKNSGMGLNTYEFAKRKINIVNSKYFTEDSDVAAETRSWFDNSQPSESQVRNAMIWSYDTYGDYSIKSGGDNNSDHIYTSYFRTTIANPTTGEDQDVIVLKKFSTDFKDVLITIEEIQELQDLTENQQVRTARRKEHLRSIISILIRHEAGYPTAEGKNGKKIMSPEKWVTDLYEELKNEYTNVEIITYLNNIKKTYEDEMMRIVRVLNKETGEYVEIENKDASPFYEKNLKALDIVKKKISQKSIFEKKKINLLEKSGKEGLKNSKSISAEMKEHIMKYITSNSTYHNKKVFNLQECAIAHKLREKDYDSVLSYSINNGQFRLSELFYLKQLYYPDKTDFYFEKIKYIITSYKLFEAVKK